MEKTTVKNRAGEAERPRRQVSRSYQSLSVLVPTRNRAESLGNLIRSLDNLTFPGSIRLEVLVVNNGSTDGTAEILQREGSKVHKYDLRIVEEPQRGKASALNRGMAASSGDILCILDDDVVVAPDWLEKILEAHHREFFDAIQGRVLPGRDPQGRSADPQRYREYNIPIIDYGNEVCEVRGLTGTNMSCKREVYETVGHFDTRLGPGASGFSEDTEYSIRIRKAGFKIGYTPHAIVYHELNPERYGREYNRTTQLRKGLSRSIYRRDSIAFNVLPNLIANCLRFGFYKLVGKSQKAYKTEGRIMKYWGYLVGKMRPVKTANSSKKN